MNIDLCWIIIIAPRLHFLGRRGRACLLGEDVLVLGEAHTEGFGVKCQHILHRIQEDDR